MIDRKIIIGITEPESRFELYRNWITGEEQNIELITLSTDQNNSEEVNRCDGILLTGGVDVLPDFYHSDRSDYPNKPKNGWDKERDFFEIEVFEQAVKLRLPILAICRGMQLVNVSLGGTLVQDLEESGKEDHTRDGESDKIHEVTIVKNSLLGEITNVTFGEVNSAHHQSINKISVSLKANCISTDGVIEGAEWLDKKGKSPLLCVQWHPERILNKKNNPLSENILNWFLKEVQK